MRAGGQTSPAGCSCTEVTLERNMQIPGTLLLASIVWVGAHVGLAGTRLRWTLARRLGENGFRAVFSILSIGAIAFLITSFNHAQTTPLWFAPGWLRWVLAFVMLGALILFVGSVAVRNPTMVGREQANGEHVRGILRVTRHPMLWSFALWAAVHIIGNGDTAAILFFGAFLVTALAGMPSIDAKLARRNPCRRGGQQGCRAWGGGRRRGLLVGSQR